MRICAIILNDNEMSSFMMRIMEEDSFVEFHNDNVKNQIFVKTELFPMDLEQFPEVKEVIEIPSKMFDVHLFPGEHSP